MLPNPGIDELARDLADRRRIQDSMSYQKRKSPRSQPMDPPIVFLGEEFAREAGVPGVEQIALRDISELMETNPKAAMRYVSPQLWEDAKWELGRSGREFDWRNPPPATRALVDAFYKRLAGQPSVVRYATLQRLYSDFPVPQPYQDLATLIKARHFTRILTINLDTMLEKALELLGLPKAHCSVTDLGDKRTAQKYAAPYSTSPAVTIIRLPAHPALDQAGVTARDIAAALGAEEDQVRLPGQDDIIMVGADGSCPPLNEWLGSTDGTIWWVSERSPEPDRLGPALNRRQLEVVGLGDIGLEGFFVQLLLRLQGGVLAPLPSTKGPISVQPSSDLEILRDRLSRARQVLTLLRSAVSRGDTARRLQMEEQERVVAELEDQLLQRAQPTVLALADELEAQLGKSPAESAGVAYLRNQLGALRSAYAEPVPDKYLVAASLQGTLAAIRGLGPDVVDPKLVEQIASYVPSGRVYSAYS